MNTQQELTTLDTPRFSADDLQRLRQAKKVLEDQSLVDRLTSAIGKPVAASIKMLPDSIEQRIYLAVDKALSTALQTALKTLPERQGEPSRRWVHTAMASVSGAVGGVLGGLTIAAELPVTTVIMLRSIAEIAREHGEDLNNVESQLACLEVFALSPGKEGVSEQDLIGQDADLGYFAVRAALAKQIRDASRYIVQRGVADSSAPPIVRLLTAIGQRFGLIVSEKVAAQAVPIFGAVSGAAINTYFMQHYQAIAEAHFTVRQLERRIGKEAVLEAFKSL